MKPSVYGNVNSDLNFTIPFPFNHYNNKRNQNPRLQLQFELMMNNIENEMLQLDWLNNDHCT